MAEKLSKDAAAEIARKDAERRAGAAATVESVQDASFPNAALGAPREGEMSFDMVASGWAIMVKAGAKRLEYRADSRQVRLVGFEGRNHLIHPG